MMRLANKIHSYLARRVLGREKGLHYLLRRAIARHNALYREISSLAIQIEGGLHPKHGILKYREYFLEHILPTDRVLDLGCGNGRVTFGVAEKATEVVGIDFNVDGIRKAREQYQRENLRFVEGDALTYDFDGRFDKVILSNVLEHIEKRVEFLQDLHKLTDVILLRVPLITRGWLPVFKRDIGLEYRLDLTHFTEYTMPELHEELANSGWRLGDHTIQFGELWGIVEAAASEDA